MKMVCRKRHGLAQFGTVIAILVLSVISSSCDDLRRGNTPRLPDATLLLDWPPNELTLTTGNQTVTLPGKQDPWLISPSISADGRVIASALPGSDYELSRREHWFTVSTYSVTNGKWTEYAGLELSHGAVSISPDGTKLACVARATPMAPVSSASLTLRRGRSPWASNRRRIATTPSVGLRMADVSPLARVSRCQWMSHRSRKSS